MKKTIILILSALLLLTGCGAKEPYEPFTPLSKATVSPEREAELQAAANGGFQPEPTQLPAVIPTEEPVIVPTFDEDSFFAEVNPDEPAPIAKAVEPTPTVEIIPTEEVPFEPDPTETPLPTFTPTPEPTVPTPVNPYGKTSSGVTTYTLQEGEDLICLCRRFNLSVSSMLSYNRLESPTDVSAGDTIGLPRSGSAWTVMDGYGNRTTVRHPANYTVRSGDTMFSVACIFGDVSPEDIAQYNGLVLGQELIPGTLLRIP